MGVSQNNIRNNQNFNICKSTRRHCSTNNINRSVEPGGSTLSRSIFAFLENRDNTNVDSNPTKTSGHLAPNRQSEGREGQTQEGCIVHQEGERLEDGQLSLKHQHRLVQTVARQRVSPRLSALPPRPPLPCCPSIIRIFSPHLLDTCMNEEIDK